MEIVFVAGLPCSGKSHFATRVVDYLGADCAVRVNLDHYYHNATRPEHFDQSNMLGYDRARIDWNLLFAHLEGLSDNRSFDTPRYNWETLERLPMNSRIGRTKHIKLVPLVLVDGFHPSLNLQHKHIYLDPPWTIREKLIQIRSKQMPLPDNYGSILRRVERSTYRDELSWLENNCWKTVKDPFNIDLQDFISSCGWSNINKLIH